MSLLLLGVGGKTSAVVPPSGFTPASIYGLERWYYQPNIDYATGTWVDRSGNAQNLVQAVGANQPAAATGPINTINGAYRVVFDGVTKVISQTPMVLPQPFSALMVMRMQTWVSDGIPLHMSTSSSGPGIWMRTPSPTLAMYAGTGYTPTKNKFSGPTFRYATLTARFDGATSLFSLDGETGAAANPGTNVAGRLDLGAFNGGASNFANIEFTDVMIYRGKVGAYDLVQLWNEWIAADRYNIPITFNPIAMTALAAWFSADASGVAYVDGDPMNGWNDRSGNARHLTQATGGSQPVFYDKMRNGLPAVYFDGSKHMRTAAFTLTQPTTVYVVGMSTATPDYFVDGAGATGTLAVRRGAGNFQLVSPTILSGDTGDSEWHVHCGVFNSTSSRIITDNGTITTGDAGTNNASGLTVGGDGTATSANMLNGYVAEVLVFNGAHTDAQAQTVIAYLSNKWALNGAIRPFDPLSVVGCKGWWRVDSGCNVSTDGAAIGILYDRSGNNNRLIESTNKPTYETSELNGYAIARFDGVDDTLRAVYTHAQPITRFIVAKQKTLTLSDYWLDGGGGVANTCAIYVGSGTTTLSYRAGTAIDGGQITVDTWNVVSAVFNGATSKLRQEGIVTASGDPGSSAAGGMIVGCAGGLTQPANLDVAEVIDYSGVLSDADIANVTAYLCARYNIGYKAPNHSSLVASLGIWLDAAQEVYANGVSVSQLTDRSGNGRNAVQLTGTNQPTFVLPSLNGRPGVDFDGSDNYLTIPDPSFGNMLVMIVASGVNTGTLASQYNPTGNQREWEMEALSATSFRAQLSADGTAVTQLTPAQSFVSGGPAIFEMGWDGSVARSWVNGVQVAASTVGKFNSSSALIIGARANLTQFSPAIIHQFIMFSAYPSETNRRAVENYLAQQFNIVV